MMNERLKAPIAEKQSYIQLRMLFFLIAISFAALFGAAAEYRLYSEALDEITQGHDLFYSSSLHLDDTNEYLINHKCDESE